MLVDCGCDVQQADLEGTSPLHGSVMIKSLDTCKLLVIMMMIMMMMMFAGDDQVTGHLQAAGGGWGRRGGQRQAGPDPSQSGKRIWFRGHHELFAKYFIIV